MSVLEFLFRCTIYGMVIVLLGILIDDIGNRNKEADPVIAVLEPKPAEMLQAMPMKSAPQPSDSPKEKPEPYRERLKRFDMFRSRVLLRDGEAMEKQRLLAHVKTIQWIESQLTASPNNGMEALGERLSMIDFLEEALAWKDNPARSEALDSMERTLKANNLAQGSKETRQMLAGDKIELFAILAEQAPNRAKELLERPQDKQLLSVFQYAIKRLAIKKLTGEER